MSDSMMKVGELRTYSRRVNLIAKVLEIGEEREVSSSRDGQTHRVAEALIGDETGTVLLTLWDDYVDRFHEGEVIEISNGYANLFRGSLRLNIGRYGEAQVVEEEIGEVNRENNLSLKQHEEVYRRPRREGRRY